MLLKTVSNRTKYLKPRQNIVCFASSFNNSWGFYWILRVLLELQWTVKQFVKSVVERPFVFPHIVPNNKLLMRENFHIFSTTLLTWKSCVGKKIRIVRLIRIYLPSKYQSYEIRISCKLAFVKCCSMSVVWCASIRFIVDASYKRYWLKH